MALILGLILTAALGDAIGAWAMADWLRYKGRLSPTTTLSEQYIQAVIAQLLHEWPTEEQPSPRTLNEAPDNLGPGPHAA